MSILLILVLVLFISPKFIRGLGISKNATPVAEMRPTASEPVVTSKQISNGMNCQNCHLDAGTKIMGNDYAAVFSSFPKFRARSGTKESVIKRISDCFKRSLNGTKPDSASREMTAMVAYMK